MQQQTRSDIEAAVMRAARERAMALAEIGSEIDERAAIGAALDQVDRLLTGHPDTRADAASRLADLIWPSGCWPPWHWWSTTLGRAIATYHPDPSSIASADGAGAKLLQREAAAMIGVVRATVASHVGAGKLPMGRDGIPVTAVMAMIAERWEAGR